MGCEVLGTFLGRECEVLGTLLARETVCLDRMRLEEGVADGMIGFLGQALAFALGRSIRGSGFLPGRLGLRRSRAGVKYAVEIRCDAGEADQIGYGNDWCDGFRRGTGIRRCRILGVLA